MFNIVSVAKLARPAPIRQLSPHMFGLVGAINIDRDLLKPRFEVAIRALKISKGLERRNERLQGNPTRNTVWPIAEGTIRERPPLATVIICSPGNAIIACCWFAGKFDIIAGQIRKAVENGQALTISIHWGPVHDREKQRDPPLAPDNKMAARGDRIIEAIESPIPDDSRPEVRWKHPNAAWA
jgi:hypothetical protein